MKRLPVLILPFCAGLILLAGCSSDPRAKVSGTVTFKDKKLTGGTVVFVTEDGLRNDYVPIQKDGSFSSTNVPVGAVRIGVEPAPKNPRANMPKGTKIPDDAPGGYAQSGDDFVDIPMSQRDPAKSLITLKVEPGEQKFDVTVKDTGEKGSGSGAYKGSKGN